MEAHEVFSALAGTPLPAQALASCAARRQLRAGEVLFHAGVACPHVYVVNQGVLKLLYETAQGQQWVKGFIEAGLCFASLTALAPGGRTSFSACAETDCTLQQIAYADLQALADRHPPWQRALAEALKLYGQRKERREMELLTLSPEERYLGFLRDHPALASRLRQRDIASYVRITPVALSRIRRRLRAQGRLGATGVTGG